MRTEKIAITIPSDLVSVIDEIRGKRGISRSKFITNILREKIKDDRVREIREAYDRIFSDKSVIKEQLETATWFEGSGKNEGQEW
jgi:metal-responsive CopG/Arc/MetJ family transcriptional regulator